MAKKLESGESKPKCVLVKNPYFKACSNQSDLKAIPKRYTRERERERESGFGSYNVYLNDTRISNP